MKLKATFQIMINTKQLLLFFLLEERINFLFFFPQEQIIQLLFYEELIREYGVKKCWERKYYRDMLGNCLIKILHYIYGSDACGIG